MKRIGILTYFGGLNTGTNLQAYCTQKAIEKLYPNDQVEIIDYHAWKEYSIPYLRGGGISIHSIMKDFRRIKEFKIFSKESLQVSKKSLCTSDYKKAIDFINSLEYDSIYVGADTILELHRVKEGITAYWLSPEINCKKFLIAASARSTHFDNLSPLQKRLVSKSINTFTLCGVRDTATYQLLSNFIADSNKIKYIPDPAFTLTIDYSFVEKYIEKRKLNFNKPTICFHLTRSETWGEELAMLLKKRGFQIASFRPNKYSDIILNDLSPFEQLGIYKYFSLMITHRFHDTIFCIKNNTPMITYPFDDSHTTTNGNSKYHSLLNDFGLAETNYLKRKSGVSAEQIFEMTDNAIHNFNTNKFNIEKKIQELNTTYFNFLQLTNSYSFSTYDLTL